MSAPLEVRGVTVRFGGLVALDDVSLRVGAGELVALVGPNGAGKSTLFNVLTGHLQPSDGRVLFDGRDITDEAPHSRAHGGLVRTWQIARPFPRLSVLDNVLVATPRRPRAGLLGAALGRGDDDAEVQRARKLLELARGLMLEPKALLLDEPFAGVNPTLARQLLERLLDLWQRGLTIVLVEHNMDLVMAHCPRVVVLAEGRVLRDGAPADVRADPRVVEAYLGGTM